MKRSGAVLIAAMLLVTFSTVRGEEKGGKTANAELKALDAKLTEAFKSRDYATLQKYAGEDLIVIDPLGRVHTRKQYFDYLAKGGVKIQELKETDVRVRIYGETGVVTGLLTLKAEAKDKNEDISGDYRWTRVYNKTGANWTVVAEQHTYVSPVERERGK